MSFPLETPQPAARGARLPSLAGTIFSLYGPWPPPGLKMSIIFVPAFREVPTGTLDFGSLNTC